jgi:hypothetical protein
VHLFVAVEAVAQLVAELGKEAGLDQGGGGGVDAWLALLVWRRLSARPFRIARWQLVEEGGVML